MDTVEKLNNETLFESRKNFGMYGNIQWWVESIENKTLKISISSSSDYTGRKNQISENIIKSVKSRLPEYTVETQWKDWEPGDGAGVLINTKNKNSKQVYDEIRNALGID